MAANVKTSRFISWIAVILLQYFMTQVMTLLASTFIPGMETMPLTHPVRFVSIVGITFTLGVFMAGWLAIKRGWLKLSPLYLWRFTGALLGAYLPLIIALLVFPGLETWIFLVSELCCVLGFYAPDLLIGKQSA